MTDFEHDDGYRNEYQRALAVSQMRRSGASTHARTVASQMVKDGLHVAVEFFPEYCPITDGLMGEGCHVLLAMGERSKLVATVQGLFEAGKIDPDSRVEIWPEEAAAPPPTSESAADDVPF